MYLCKKSLRYLVRLEKIPTVNAMWEKRILRLDYKKTYTANIWKDRLKDRRSQSYDRDRDRRSFFKWRSGSRSRSQFLAKIGIAIAISLLAIGLMLWVLVSVWDFPIRIWSLKNSKKIDTVSCAQNITHVVAVQYPKQHATKSTS